MDKNTRICIVGGGPAGLSAGMYLEQKGYENYTILERLDRVGGKCWSPHYNGRRYEMGAIMGVPSYYAVEDVEKFCGITHDGPKLNRNYKDANGNVIEPFARTLGNIIRNHARQHHPQPLAAEDEEAAQDLRRAAGDQVQGL